ncbi:MAG: hypothetical protein ABH885_06090 [Candidatus Omnitrophota bacterium]
MKRSNANTGMTLPELLVGTIAGIVVATSLFSMWYFAHRNWAVQRMEIELRSNLEMAVEKLREEMRLSSTSYISLYKVAGESDYSAIGFPMATKDANGFYALNPDGTIFWDTTVIYHVFENPPGSGDLELRRTVFTGNNSVLTVTADREAQLASVVATGDGSAAQNSANASTRVIFKNLVGLAIASSDQGVDLYSGTTERSDNIKMGSIKLASGDHAFTFSATGKNSMSGGFSFGIDTISINPSGCLLEAEYYTGIGTTNIYAPGWSGNYYSEYSAAGIGDSVTFTLYYDLWREANWNASVRSNTLLTGTDPHVALAGADDLSTTFWDAAAQTSELSQDYPSEGGQPSLDNYAVRNVLSGSTGNDFIDRDANEKKIRVKFQAGTTADFVISAAWFAERSAASGEDAAGIPVQLLFGGAASVTVPAGGEQWSDWVEFTLEDDKDYLVTFYTTSANFRYWKASAGVNSYYDNDPNDDSSSNAADAAASDWINYTASPCIFAADTGEQWPNVGTVTSNVYDTKVDGASLPEYGTISWEPTTPIGTAITMEVRAGDLEDMTDATGWLSVSNGGSVPVACDGKRYIQFRATMTSSTPYANLPSIDNVEIDWPGDVKICEISCYFTKKSDYGIVGLTVDGNTLRRTYEFTVTVYDFFRGTRYESSMTADIEPRNTGL